MLALVILIILVFLIFGALPRWPYMSAYNYGYWPSGLFLIILLILVVLFFTGTLGAYHWP
jgi:hypothetical protein